MGMSFWYVYFSKLKMIYVPRTNIIHVHCKKNLIIHKNMKYNDFESHHSEITTVNLKVTLLDVFMDTHTIHTHIQNPTYLFINLSMCCFATCFFSSCVRHLFLF